MLFLSIFLKNWVINNSKQYLKNIKIIIITWNKDLFCLQILKLRFNK